MKIFRLYSVQSWDGGSLHNHSFWLDNEESAIDYVKQNKFDIYVEREFIVYSSLEDKEINSLTNLIDSAKSKLTEAEWKAITSVKRK